MIGQKGVPATYGGIERHVHELSMRLVVRGVPVEVYCRHHYTAEDAELEGVELLRLPSVNTKHLDAITHVSLCAMHAVTSRANVVHFHALGPSSLAWIPRITGKKIVVTVHGLDWKREKWGAAAAAYLRMCEWTATHLAHATVVVSKTLRDHFEAAGAPNVHYVPNGTVLPAPAPPDAAQALGLDPGRYLLFVGRLVPEKGLHILVRAHREAVPDWPLIIVGGGHFTEDYVESCRREANPNVRFLGPVYGAELASVQQHARLVVVPSSIEGLSIALLEAMSFGRPVLGSDIPENLEVLDGVGESFRTGDVADLGRRLTELLASPERLEEIGQRGRERIETEYDWERVADRTAALYRSLVPETRK